MTADLLQRRHRRVIRRGFSWLGLVAGLAVLTVVGVAGWFWVNQAGKSVAADLTPITSKVVRTDFVHEVTERGEIESSSNIEIRCEVEASSQGTAILWIIPEGTYVEPGEKLVELDSSALVKEETQQQIVYEQARAAVIQAELAAKAAEVAIEEYAEGLYKQELQTIDSEIVVAEENLRRAQDYAGYSEKLYAKGFVTSVQLEADKFAVKNSEIALATAQTKREVLEKYTRTKTLNQLRSDARTAEAQMKAYQASFKLESDKLKRIQKQIKACTMFAPAQGQVVYANETDRRGNSETVIEPGLLVRERQVIIRLPDMSKMQVRARVNESRVNLVKVDQSVRVRVDALQGMQLDGTVTKVDALPLPTSWSRGNIKEYAVIVTIHDPPARLKPGMTAEVSILVNTLNDVIQVPVQAIMQRRNGYVCYQHTPEGPVEVPVKIGPTNEHFVVIEDGLKPDEKVVLDPRSYLRKIDPNLVKDEPTPRFVTNTPRREKGKGKGKRPPSGGKGAPAKTRGKGDLTAKSKTDTPANASKGKPNAAEAKAPPKGQPEANSGAAGQGEAE